MADVSELGMAKKIHHHRARRNLFYLLTFWRSMNRIIFIVCQRDTLCVEHAGALGGTIVGRYGYVRERKKVKMSDIIIGCFGHARASANMCKRWYILVRAFGHRCVVFLYFYGIGHCMYMVREH